VRRHALERRFQLHERNSARPGHGRRCAPGNSA
jgi:hypothetical protein